MFYISFAKQCGTCAVPCANLLIGALPSLFCALGVLTEAPFILGGQIGRDWQQLTSID